MQKKTELMRFVFVIWFWAHPIKWSNPISIRVVIRSISMKELLKPLANILWFIHLDFRRFQCIDDSELWKGKIPRNSTHPNWHEVGKNELMQSSNTSRSHLGWLATVCTGIFLCSIEYYEFLRNIFHPIILCVCVCAVATPCSIESTKHKIRLKRCHSDGIKTKRKKIKIKKNRIKAIERFLRSIEIDATISPSNRNSFTLDLVCIVHAQVCMQSGSFSPFFACSRAQFSTELFQFQRIAHIRSIQCRYAYVCKANIALSPSVCKCSLHVRATFGPVGKRDDTPSEQSSC